MRKNQICVLRLLSGYDIFDVVRFTYERKGL